MAKILDAKTALANVLHPASVGAMPCRRPRVWTPFRKDSSTCSDKAIATSPSGLPNKPTLLKSLLQVDHNPRGGELWNGD